MVGQRQKIDPSTLISNTFQDFDESTLNPDLNLKFQIEYFQIHPRASYFCNQTENGAKHSPTFLAFWSAKGRKSTPQRWSMMLSGFSWNAPWIQIWIWNLRSSTLRYTLELLISAIRSKIESQMVAKFFPKLVRNDDFLRIFHEKINFSNFDPNRF